MRATDACWVAVRLIDASNHFECVGYGNVAVAPYKMQTNIGGWQTSINRKSNRPMPNASRAAFHKPAKNLTCSKTRFDRLSRR